MNASRMSTLAALAAGLLGAAAGAHAAEYANVVSATPVMQSVGSPRQECVQGAQVVQQQPSGAGALIGAIVGGVAGNQFGHGVGRAAATGLGVVAGSAIGNNVEAGNAGTATVPVERCRTVNGYENRVVGYDVVYDYNGQRYTTRLPRDPGPKLAIDVRPAAAAPLDRVGPPATYGAVPPQTYDSYGEAPAYAQGPAYYAPAPAYYAGSPYYYGVPAYVGPAVIGLGLGYWAGRSWHGGGYYHGGYRHWH